jgi:hypothetical protein
MDDIKRSNDMRCIKTKRAIKNALAALMAEKDISQITIKEISDFALINRKTFYSHYSSVFDILSEIENEIIDKFSGIIDSIDFDQERFDPSFVFNKLTSLIYTDFDFYKYLMRSRAYSNLVEKIKEAFKERMLDVCEKKSHASREKLDCALEFVAAGMSSVYQQWFNSDRKQSLEEISNTLSVMTFSGLNSLIDIRDPLPANG